MAAPYASTMANAASSAASSGGGVGAAAASAAGLGEVRLWANQKEREMYESLAELFAIIKTTERLEKAYVRDVVGAREYESACYKLIGQFRTLRSSLGDSVPDLQRFAATYRLDCPSALHRLLVVGVPATVEHQAAAAAAAAGSEAGSGSDGSAAARGGAAGGVSVAAKVAECVQAFITAMDSVKLGMLAVDQLHPLLAALLHALNALPPDLLPQQLPGSGSSSSSGGIGGEETTGVAGMVRGWLVKLNGMAASQELTEDQARQLSFDLETAYNAFMQHLPRANMR